MKGLTPFLGNEKMQFILNPFFIALYSFFTFVSLFDAEGSTHDSAKVSVRILERQGLDECFAFEVDALLSKKG